MWSVDKIIMGKNWPSTIPFWTYFILRFQFCLVYIFGGIAKLNYDWLHGHPVKEWLVILNAKVIGLHL